MHTWSLGIEEQYYLIYPFILLLLSKINLKLVNYFLLIITLASIFLFTCYGNTASRFYLLHFRFFELSIGGFFAILLYNTMSIHRYYKYLFYGAFISLLLLLFIPYGNNQIKVMLTTLFTICILVLGRYYYQEDKISKYVLQNKLVIYLGKISFSLYLWHQLIFAFFRYVFFESIGLLESLLLIFLTVLLSAITYHFIENPFRNKNLISSKNVYWILSIVFLISTSSAIYIYLIGGVYKDFPSVGITKNDVERSGYNFFSSTENIHIKYNEDARKLDVDFQYNTKPKILVIGNSYGRDVVNIFSESSIANEIDLIYFDINKVKTDQDIIQRWQQADLIVFAAKNVLKKDWVKEVASLNGLGVDFDKIICFGTKDFGYSNGIHYNNISTIKDFTQYYVNMRKGIIKLELELKKEWNTNYVSLIEPVANDSGQIRIFNKDGKFLSQDTLHLTKAGAVFYATILNTKLKLFLENYKPKVSG
jgi:hypothetical protein